MSKNYYEIVAIFGDGPAKSLKVRHASSLDDALRRALDSDPGIEEVRTLNGHRCLKRKVAKVRGTMVTLVPPKPIEAAVTRSLGKSPKVAVLADDQRFSTATDDELEKSVETLPVEPEPTQENEPEPANVPNIQPSPVTPITSVAADEEGRVRGLRRALLGILATRKGERITVDDVFPAMKAAFAPRDITLAQVARSLSSAALDGLLVRIGGPHSGTYEYRSHGVRVVREPSGETVVELSAPLSDDDTRLIDRASDLALEMAQLVEQLVGQNRLLRTQLADAEARVVKLKDVAQKIREIQELDL